MTGSNRRIAAGTNSAFIGFYDDNGFPTGGTPTAPANALVTGNPSYNIVGIKTASPTVPEPEVEPITGDDILIGEFDFPSIATRRFTIDIAVGDLTLDANLQGTLVETIADAKVGAQDIADPVELDSYLILQGRAKKQDAGVKGKKGYEGVFIPLAHARPLGRVGFTERGAAIYRLSIAPQLTGNNIWGVTILEENAGTTGLRARPFSSEYPVAIDVFSGNGIVTDWTLKHRPISVIKTNAWADRLSQAVSAVVAATHVATIPAVRTGGRIIFAYQYDVFVE